MDAQSLKLSILVPAYNVEHFLERCVNSVLNQVHEFELEILIINDGSEDHTGDIISELERKHDCIKTFTIPNQGVYKARNFGLQQISGDYVWMIDADDYINDNVLEKIHNQLQNTKVSVDVLHLGYQQQKPDKTWQLKQPNDQHGEIITGFEFLRRSDGRLFLWNNIYRTDFLTDNKIRFLAKSVSLEDSLFNIEAFSKAKNVHLLNLNAYSYCYNINSISKKASLKHLEDKGISSYNVHSHIKKIRDSYPVISDQYNIINHRLNHSILGFFFSLYKDGYTANYANKMLGTYSTENLLPIQPLPSPLRLRLFAILVNTKWPYKILKMTKRA